MGDARQDPCEIDIAEALDVARALRQTGCLTGRERDVFELLGLGWPNRSIAQRLDLAEQTVKAHVTRILRKLGVQSRTQAAIVAFANRGCRDRYKGRDTGSSE